MTCLPGSTEAELVDVSGHWFYVRLALPLGHPASHPPRGLRDLPGTSDDDEDVFREPKRELIGEELRLAMATRKGLLGFERFLRLHVHLL